MTTQERNEIKARCAPVAQRMVIAENNFIVSIQKFSGCSQSAAAHVLAVYRKLNVVKMDAVNGVINVKHGAYFEKEVIENAINFQI